MPTLAEITGQNVRRVRRQRGMSQERLGQVADVDLKYVGLIERGAANFTVAVLERIARALEVDAAELLRQRGGAGKRASPREVLALLRHLDPRGLSFVRDLVATYVAHESEPRRPDPA